MSDWKSIHRFDWIRVILGSNPSEEEIIKALENYTNNCQKSGKKTDPIPSALVPHLMVPPDEEMWRLSLKFLRENGGSSPC